MIEVPHFALPFRFTTGSGIAVTEQDSDEEIADCVKTILSYKTGQRPEKPEFGIPDQTFNIPGPNTQEITASVAEWEPRINPLAISELITNLDFKVKVEVNSSE